MTYVNPRTIAEILALAGGRIIGRTRLQKSVCALELTGLGYGFSFSYKHFGPFSDELKLSCDYADALGLIHEERKKASWGGDYSVFQTSAEHFPKEKSDTDKCREALLGVLVNADPVAVELAVTAAFLACRGFVSPWGEVVQRKQAKATPRTVLEAKELYKQMQSIDVPKALPDIQGSSLVSAG